MKTKSIRTTGYVCEFCNRDFDGKSACANHEQQHLDIRENNKWVKVGDTVFKPELDVAARIGIVLKIEMGGERFLCEHPTNETRYWFDAWVYRTQEEAVQNGHRWSR